MAPLAHRKNAAKGVRATGAKPMDFPFTTQHGVTAAGMVGAGLHRALAPASGLIVYIVPKSHYRVSPFIESALIDLGSEE